MRPTAKILATTFLALGAAALLAGAADSKPKRHKARKTPSAKVVATEAAPPAAETLPPVTGLNADGSIRAPLIEDAPAGDYERVAWCHGVLSGDMALAEYVAPVQPVDGTIQLIGQSYLRAYEAALTLSGQGASAADHARADTARQRGYDGWQGALTSADLKKAAWAYDNWQLPGDCEHAAVRLSGHPNLFGEMATDAEAQAIADTLSSGGPHDYKDLPKPVLTAAAAPQDGDAPISTNTLARRAKQSAGLPTVTESTAPAASSDATTPAGNGTTN